MVDGVLQLAPERASLALLAVDALEPWGRAQAVPPRGDLRAPIDDLLAASDTVVTVGEGDGDDAHVVSGGAWQGAEVVPWSALRTRRLGLACALARTERVLRMLRGKGVVPVAVAAGADHGPVPVAAMVAAEAAGVDGWLATAKCALHVPPPWSAAVLTIDYDLRLSGALLARLAGLLAPAPRTGLPCLDRRSMRQ